MPRVQEREYQSCSNSQSPVNLLRMTTEKCKAIKHMRRCSHIPTPGKLGGHVLKTSDSFTRARSRLAQSRLCELPVLH